MNENLERKHQIVDAVRQEFLAANVALLAEYRGVSVAGMTELRRKARESNVNVRIVKNTLARRAVDDTDFECLTEHFGGPLAIAVSEDPVAVAKVLSEFAKNNDAFEIRVGAMNRELLSPENIAAIAKLPGRDELIATLLGTMTAPIQQLVNTLNQVPASLVRVLAAIRDSKQDESTGD